MARHACGPPTLLRSTEGVGAESHRVAGSHRGWHVRGVAGSRGVAGANRIDVACHDTEAVPDLFSARQTSNAKDVTTLQSIFGG
eukprot:scaffold4983_cov55-Phaeocystis_antarctica.AAC.1